MREVTKSVDSRKDGEAKFGNAAERRHQKRFPMSKHTQADVAALARRTYTTRGPLVVENWAGCYDDGGDEG